MSRTISTNTAHQKRNPWRNKPGPKHATKQQTAYIRLLEQTTNSRPADLTDWKQADASDYIIILQHRMRKTGAKLPPKRKKPYTDRIDQQTQRSR